MPSRPKITVPDPLESITISSLPTFRYVRDQNHLPWLPDITEAHNLPEAGPSDEVDELPKAKFRPCPQEARVNKNELEIIEQSEEIAEWVFETYSRLVFYRLVNYNLWREVINAFPKEDDRPMYRRACRLATEQILRRDLPQDLVAFEYDYTILPIFEIGINLKIDEKTDLVLGMQISATVEVRQRQVRVRGEFDVEKLAQDSWSSSSSSSSESSYFPN